MNTKSRTKEKDEPTPEAQEVEVDTRNVTGNFRNWATREKAGKKSSSGHVPG
jgi:NADPH:quinone reductase-like Zn-dependent oxidoreductase